MGDLFFFLSLVDFLNYRVLVLRRGKGGKDTTPGGKHCKLLRTTHLHLAEVTGQPLRMSQGNLGRMTPQAFLLTKKCWMISGLEKPM